MCGLIGIIGRPTDNPELKQDFLLDQYDAQHRRGSEGFGLIEASNKTMRIRRATQESKALIDIIRTDNPVMFFHHRLPTSTDNEQSQTHPIRVTHDELDYDWYFMHNGVIRNAKELAEIHQDDLGYAYTTLIQQYSSTGTKPWGSKFNDSEALAIELARYFEGKENEIRTEGAVAFLGVRVNKKTQLAEEFIWGRNDMHNDLYVAETPEGILIASELVGGEKVLDLTADSILMKDVYSKSKGTLFSKVKTRALFFNELEKEEEPEPIKSPIALAEGKDNTATPKDTAIKKHKDDGTIVVNEKLPKVAPEGFTEREWALRKLALRNKDEFSNHLLELFDDIAYQDPLESQETWEQFNQNIEDFTFDLLFRAKEIKERFDGIETEEAMQDAQMDIDEAIENMSNYMDPIFDADHVEDSDHDIYSVNNPKYGLS